MAEIASETAVEKKLDRYIQQAKDLAQTCEKFDNVKGISKLIRKVLAEVKFLEGLCGKTGKNKENGISSSNLVNVKGIVDAIETFPDVTHVLQPFQCPGYEHSLVVDVVCNHGYTWVKVIARKAQALHLIWAGDGQYGEKSINAQAEQFLQCASLHPVKYTVPQIVFVFRQGITKEMQQHLLKMGIHVKGAVEEVEESTRKKLALMQSYSDSDSDSDSKASDSGDSPFEACSDSSSHDTHSKETNQSALTAMSSPTSVNFVACPDIQKVNLDVTTMIVLVSNVCHGRCHFQFQEEILNQQAESERQCPVLPSIQAFLKGKDVYACNTAILSFRNIVRIVGGPTEQQRAEELLETITPIPDEMSDRTKNLNTSAQLKTRARIIFGTGDFLKAVTTTSNMGFVRAAQNQGLDFAVFLHDSRALTEQKEGKATPL